MENIARLGLEFDSRPFSAGVAESVDALRDLSKESLKAEASVAGLNKAFELVKRTALALGLTFGFYRMSQWIREANDLAARYETLGIVLQTTGRAAGYTAVQLSGIEQSLRKQGIAAMEARQSMMQFIQSNLDLRRATELATVAQNTAVIANENSSATYLRLIHAIQSGRSEILRNLGVTVNWMKAYRDMANELKVGINDLTEYDKIQARTNAVIAAGATAAEAYDAAMGTAGKQANSLKRYMDDLKTSVGEAFQPMYREWIAGLTEAIKQATAFAREHRLAIQNIAEGMVVLGAAITATYALWKSWGRILILLAEIRTAVLAMWGAFQMGVALTGTFAGVTGALKVLLGGLGAFIAGNPILVGIIAGIGLLAGAFMYFRTEANKAALEVEKFHKALVDFGRDAKGNAVEPTQPQLAQRQTQIFNLFREEQYKLMAAEKAAADQRKKLRDLEARPSGSATVNIWLTKKTLAELEANVEKHREIVNRYVTDLKSISAITTTEARRAMIAADDAASRVADLLQSTDPRPGIVKQREEIEKQRKALLAALSAPGATEEQRESWRQALTDLEKVNQQLAVTLDTQKKIADMTREWAERVADLRAAQTPTGEDDAQIQLSRMMRQATEQLAAMRKEGITLTAAQLTEFWQQVGAAVELTRQQLLDKEWLRGLQEEMEAFGREAGAALGSNFEAEIRRGIDRSAALFVSLRERLDAMDVDDPARTSTDPTQLAQRRALEQALAQVLQVQAQLRQRLADLTGTVALTVEETLTAEQARTVELAKQLALQQGQARNIEAAVRGAVQLGTAMGVISRDAGDLVESVAQVAANLGAAKTGIKGLLEGKLGFGAALSAAMPVVGGIAQGISVVKGLFGESPEERRRREVMEKNTQAIKDLTTRIGDWAGPLGNVPGKTFTGLQGLLDNPNPYALGGGMFNVVLTGALSKELAKLGLTMSDLEEVARNLGISFAASGKPTLQELQQLRDALRAMDFKLWTDSFVGQLDLLRSRFEMFDITDPIKQLEKLLLLFRTNLGSGPLREMIGSMGLDDDGNPAAMDLNTEAGRSALLLRLQQMFDMLARGEITPEMLGGLSPQDFLKQLLQIEQMLDSIDATAETNQSFAVNRSITEVTGSRIAALLDLSNFYLKAIAENTGGVRGTSPDPTVPTARSGPGVVIEQVTVQVTTGATTPTAVAQETATATVDAISVELARRTAVTELLRGF